MCLALLLGQDNTLLLQTEQTRDPDLASCPKRRYDNVFSQHEASAPHEA